jgi:hypothetical protein
VSRDVDMPYAAEVDAALALAYAPLRRRSAALSPARVRAAVRWDRSGEAGRGWQAVAVLGRMAETSLAFALTALVFIGTLSGLAEQAVAPSELPERPVRAPAAALPDYERHELLLLRLGRGAVWTTPADDMLDPARLRLQQLEQDERPRERGPDGFLR